MPIAPAPTPAPTPELPPLTPGGSRGQVGYDTDRLPSLSGSGERSGFSKTMSGAGTALDIFGTGLWFVIRIVWIAACAGVTYPGFTNDSVLLGLAAAAYGIYLLFGGRWFIS